jgi:hypothetical protein
VKYIPFDPDSWGHEFDAWADRLGGIPQALICSATRNGDYVMDCAHLFEIWPGRYALVLEEGCSCYDVRDARIYIYGRGDEAVGDFFAWCDSRERPRRPFNPSGVEEKGP